MPHVSEVVQINMQDGEKEPSADRTCHGLRHLLYLDSLKVGNTFLGAINGHVKSLTAISR